MSRTEKFQASKASTAGTNGFVIKVWTMVNAPEESLIQWSENGSTVMVLDVKQFAQTVLPKYFKHNNMDSFVRQMNIYGFKKVQNITDGAMMPPEYMQIEYENPFFVRGRFDLTKNIVRDSQKRKNKNTGILREMIDDIKKKQDEAESDVQSLAHLNKHLIKEVADLKRRHESQVAGINAIFESALHYIQKSHPAERKRKES